MRSGTRTVSETCQVSNLGGTTYHYINKKREIYLAEAGSTQALVRNFIISKKKPGTLPFIIVFDSVSKRETVPIFNLRKNAYEIPLSRLAVLF